MSLHRTLRRDDKRESFVNAACEVPQNRSEIRFPLLKASVNYASGATLSSVL